MPGPIRSRGGIAAPVHHHAPVPGHGLPDQPLQTPSGPLMVPAAIKRKWDSLASETTFAGGSVQAHLGWPLRRLELPLHGGSTVVFFERGEIVLRPDGRCFVVYGVIYLKYAALLDGQSGDCDPGLPISDEDPVPDGRCSRFDNADIYWSPASGAHEVHGPIRDKWQELAGVESFLGFPLADETPVVNTTGQTDVGRMSVFQRGSIYWSQGTGAWEVHGDIRRAWIEQHGGPTGALGFPISDQASSSTGKLSYGDFQGGCLVSPGSYGGIRKLTNVLLVLGRFDGYGDDRDLYVYASASTSAGNSISERIPEKDYYGASVEMNSGLIRVERMRGSSTIDLTLDAWDDVSGGDDLHVGTVRDHLDLERIWDNIVNGHPQDVTDQDFRATYSMQDAVPVDPKDPAFRQHLFWGFANRGADTKDDQGNLVSPELGSLTYMQFHRTFTDVEEEKKSYFWHPFHALFYDWFYEGLAAGGICFGMCLEANDALAGRSVFSEPINNLQFKGTVEDEILLKHGYQVGGSVVGYFIDKFMSSETHDPKRCYDDSQRFYENNDYPIINLTDGFFSCTGHSVRPYRWDDADPDHLRIYVANPNDPYRADPNGATGDNNADNYIDLFKHVDLGHKYYTFRFDFAPGSTWTGGENFDGRMYALPWSIMNEQPELPCWEPLLALIAAACFFLVGDATTQQITDGDGHTFYKTPAGTVPTRWNDINTDAGSRIPGLARVPLFVRAPAPELYRLQDVRPFGPSPAEAAAPTPPHVGGSAQIPQIGGSAHLPQIGGSAHLQQIEGAGGIAGVVGATLDWISGRAVVGPLKHEVLPGSGEYTWAFQSAGASAIAKVRGGAKNLDILSLSNPGHAAQALSLTLGKSNGPRTMDLTLVSSGLLGPSNVRIFNLSGLAPEAGKAFTAGLTPDGSQIVLQNAGARVGFALDIRSGPGPQGKVSRASVTLEANQVATIQPDTWDVAHIGTSPVSMSVLDKVDGSVLRQFKI